MSRVDRGSPRPRGQLPALWVYSSDPVPAGTSCSVSCSGSSCPARRGRCGCSVRGRHSIRCWIRRSRGTLRNLSWATLSTSTPRYLVVEQPAWDRLLDQVKLCRARILIAADPSEKESGEPRLSLVSGDRCLAGVVSVDHGKGIPLTPAVDARHRGGSAGGRPVSNRDDGAQQPASSWLSHPSGTLEEFSPSVWRAAYRLPSVPIRSRRRRFPQPGHVGLSSGWGRVPTSRCRSRAPCRPTRSATES